MQKTRFIMVRHGESEANVANRFCGHTDIPLTQRGQEQASRVPGYVSNYNIDILYSSDLTRAYTTAIPTSEALGLPIIKNVQLREIFAGDWEGHYMNEIRESVDNEQILIWRNDIAKCCPPNGESVVDLTDRILTEVKRLAKEHLGQTVCFFSHGTPIRVMGTLAQGRTLDELKDLPWPVNASSTVIDMYEDGSMELIVYSETSYMDDIGFRSKEYTK